MLKDMAVSEDGKKVRRQHPLTESDMEELQSRIVVTENLPEDHCYQNLVKIFSSVGCVNSIRTCQPQTSNGGVSSASRSRKTDSMLFSNKAQQGEGAIAADLAGPAYKFELSSTVPSVGLPKATFKFPLGEVSLEEKEEEEVKRMLSINGIIKGHLLNGVCTAQYNDESLKLRYFYKDEQMAFIPSISHYPRTHYHLHSSAGLVLPTS